MGQPARNEVATRVQEQAVTTSPETASMFDVITQAIKDPSLDVEKLERLTGLFERMTDRQAEVAYNDAMNAAQEEMRPIAADANNSQTHSKYASFAALDRALRPIYTRHGFSLRFGTDECPVAEHVRVVCRIAHRSGHKEVEHIDMPADGKGAKGGDVMTKTHAVGAAVTYGRRYLLGMVFNIAVGDPGVVDDDGNGNGGREASPAAQKAIAEINACESVVDLGVWKKQHFSAVEKAVSDRERNDIVALWNRRLKALKEQPAADDFPGDR